MTRLPFPDPPLEDELILLRPWSMADVGPAWTATQDPLIWRHTHVPERQSEDETCAASSPTASRARPRFGNAHDASSHAARVITPRPRAHSAR